MVAAARFCWPPGHPLLPHDSPQRFNKNTARASYAALILAVAALISPTGLHHATATPASAAGRDGRDQLGSIGEFLPATHWIPTES